MEDFEYINKEHWKSVSCDYNLSEEFIERHKNDVDWFYISIYQKLSEPFIEKYHDKVDWKNISICQKLSEDFIEKYQNLLDWFYISIYQKLSESFIEKFQDKVVWYNISTYQTLSDEFIEKHQLSVNKNDLWQYKPENFKKQKLIETKKYECYEDYFIAYKKIRSDRYSLFNFQYQYIAGKTYESTCDCSANENSFGLNVGTYDFTKNYLGEKNGIVIKCKVYYKDIGRIVYDGEKVRCFKITFLE